MQATTRRLTARRAAALLCTLLAVLMAVPAAADAGAGEEKDKQVKRDVRILRLPQGELMRLPHGELLRVSRGYLGVQLLALTPELRTHFGVPDDAGALVASVEAGSPAEKAGVKVGDVLTRVNGETVEGPHDVRMQLRDAEEGDTASLEVYRGGRPASLTATIEKRERSEMDLSQMFMWEEGPGEGKVLRFDPEMMGDAKEKLEPFEFHLAPGKHPQLINLRGREKELEKRLAELEKRIKELEKQLQR
jgi:hypothetical protein